MTTLAALLAGGKPDLARALSDIERDPESGATLDLLDAAYRAPRAQVLGITGPPGVGKSTLTGALIAEWRRSGRSVGVLAVDPSSQASGGALLGDRARIAADPGDEGVFIRSLAARDRLGGLADLALPAATLMAALYDVLVVETVGVGQSETLVAEMCDLFVLLLAPAGGDELQGVKRGIMEMADLILVNKADGDLLAAARRTCADYAGALRLLRKRPQDPEGFPKAMCVSAAEARGLEEVWDDIRALSGWRRDQGILAARRAAQARHWFEEEVRQGLLARLTADRAMRAEMETLGAAVEAGLPPSEAAARMLARLGGSERA